MRKINKKFKKYIKVKSLSTSPYEEFSLYDIQQAYEAGYKQAAWEILSIWKRPKNMLEWLKARHREDLVYIENYDKRRNN